MMIEFKNLEEYTEYSKIRECWNKEIELIYPISEKLFLSSIINNHDLLKTGSYVALHNGEVVGFILGKTWNDTTKIPNYDLIGWISLFFVNSKYRKQGIGTKLLELLEKSFKSLNKKTILLGRDTFNFFPGLPVDFINKRKWFLNRGYELVGEDHDMIRYFDRTPKYLSIPENPYEVRIANIEDKIEIEKFFERCFKGRWEYEAKSYFESGGTGREFVIVLDGKKVIAFARINDKSSPQLLYNINWKDRFKNQAGIGPLGVDQEYRKQKIGYIVTAFAVNEVQKRGCNECIIDWTGLVDFYHLFNFEVWKTYYKLEKKIN